MKGFFIAAVAIAGAAALSVTAAAQNNSTSGYVSLTDGVMIAGQDKTTVIRYDTNEFDSVKRAADDLAGDIKAVTDAQVLIADEGSVTYSDEDAPEYRLDIADGKMTVTVNSRISEETVCYVAAYDANGVVRDIKKGLSRSTQTYGDGKTETVFSFDEAVNKPSGGEAKAFVWDNMKPVPDTLPNAKKTADTGADILIGTLGEGGDVDELANGGYIDVSAIEDKKESFTIQSVGDGIVIAGSDKRGTIFGIYDLSEKIGVSPWKFWADVSPETARELYVDESKLPYTEGEPSVEYRGIFLNDEFNLNKWSNSQFEQNMNAAKYEKVYELILRLKMNTLWPAMHNYSTAFHNIDGAAAKADEYGIVIGSSHAEPLLRNNLGELDAYQDAWEAAHPDKKLYKPIQNESGKKVAYYWTDHDGDGNAADNKEFLTDYWRDSVKANGEYDNIYTIGMRGVHDGSFSTNMDYETALKEIIAAQINILKTELVGEGGRYSKIEDVPIVFIPYKDVLAYYNKPDRLDLPEYVTIMWTDDNYGYMRQNSNDTERMSSGGGGVYYHVSYYGWPTSYLWLSSSQPGLIREQLTRSYEMGADKMWILNVGDLKPAEKEIEYYARLAKDVDGMNETDIADVYAHNAKRDFNMDDTRAAQYADIMDEYYELANSKRPEFYRTNDEDNNLNISPTAYGDESRRYIERYKDILSRAETLYEELDESKKPSFYELALYPIRSAKNIAVDFAQTSHASLYDRQGRGGAVNPYSAEANAAAAQIDTDTAYYNSMLSGKWSNMMVINPSHFSSCDARITTALNPPVKTSLEYTNMEIASDTAMSPDEISISVSRYDAYAKYIDIINTGYGSFDYEAVSDNNSVKLSKKGGTVYSDERIYITADAEKAPQGESETVITVKQKLGDNVVKECRVNVSVNNASYGDDEKMYISSDGTLSIEAEHYSRITANGVYEWRIEKDFGRSGDSLKIYPNLSDDVANTADGMKADSACAEYDIYLEDAGDYTVSIYRMPTLNERGTCRVGIGLDSGDPVSIGGTNAYPSNTSGTQTKTNAWPNNVLKNCEILKTTLKNVSAGKHTLKMYSLSSGMVIDKIVLVKGEAPYSYFGAPESYNTTFNSGIDIPETTADTPKDESGITRIFEPKAVIGDPVKAGASIAVPIYRIDDSLDSAIVAVSVFDDSGEMTSADFKAVTFTDGKVQASLEIPEDAVNYEIIAFDSFTKLHPVAPVREYGAVVKSASSGMGEDTAGALHTGKSSVIIIADTAVTEDMAKSSIKYLRGENLTVDSYSGVPFPSDASGTYYLRVGIDGAEPIDKTVSFDPAQYVIRPLLTDGETQKEGTQIFAQGTGNTNQTVSVSDLPAVIYEDGKYYVLSENAEVNKSFKYETRLSDMAEQTIYVSYTRDENIVRYTEFETFGKNTVTGEGLSSGGAGSLNDSTFLTLMDAPAAGAYELTAGIYGSNGGKFKLKYGDNTDVASTTEWTPSAGTFIADFELLEGSDLTQLRMSKNATVSPVIDYIIIRRMPDSAQYTVKAVTPEGAEICALTPTTASMLSVSGLPEAVEKDGVYYRLSDGLIVPDTHTKRIMTPVSEGDTVTVRYTLDENILFYADMEDYEHITSSTDTRYSKGGAAYVLYNYFAKFGDVVFPAGKYEFEGYITSRGNSVGLRFKKAETDSSNFMTLPSPLFETNKADVFKYQFELSEPTTLVMAGLSNTGGQAGTPEFDYILVKKVQ